MNALTIPQNIRRGIELGFLDGRALVYDGTEPVAIDAQAGKGKLTRFLGANLVGLGTAHFSKIITDPKDGELVWMSWKTLERQGYKVRFINPMRLYGYASESYNPMTPALEIARRPELHPILGQVCDDIAANIAPVDPNPNHRWIGQGMRTAFSHYIAITALHPSPRFPCSLGGLWDFYGRSPEEIAEDLLLWASDSRLQDRAGMSSLIAGFTQSPNQWNAYSSVVLERLQGFQRGSAARIATDSNSFDPADMKTERTALFIIGTAKSASSRAFVGMMAASIIDRFVEAHGPLHALVVGEEWGQLYVGNFHEILTLYREAGINLLAVFQNATAQIKGKYGDEAARLWRKAVAHTIYRGLPDDEELKGIELRSGKTSVMVRGFNASINQVSGSGDTLGEQVRPLLQVEDTRRLTGGEQALLESRDHGFFAVDQPNFWERPDLSGKLRDVRTKPDKYAWLRPQVARELI